MKPKHRRNTFSSLTILTLNVCLGFPAWGQQVFDGRTASRLEGRPSSRAFVPGEVIVKMRDTTAPAAAMSTAAMELEAITGNRTSGNEIVYRVPQAQAQALGASEMRDQTLEIVEELAARSDVEYAQPNYIMYRADRTPNDPLFPQQWHYHNYGVGPDQSLGGIGLPKVWETNRGGGSNVVVAVIDTGILPNHPDISGSPQLGCRLRHDYEYVHSERRRRA